MQTWRAAGFALGCSIISFFGRFTVLNSSALGLYWLRRFYSFLCNTFTGPREFVHRVEDIRIAGPDSPLKLRLYRPNQGTNLPAVIFLHGGCLCVGDLDSHDASARALCNATSALVIAVDYRLTPEHQFPAPAEDAYHVLNWAVDNARRLGIDTEKIVIAGDSAGGALATTVARWSRDRRGPKPAAQLLIYPMTDSSLQSDSAREFAGGPVISRALLERAWAHYSPNEQIRLSGEVSPLAATDLRNLPYSIIVTAERDLLRDEAEDYAEALRRSGVRVSLRRYPDTVHGFFQIPSSKHGRLVISDIALALREHFELCAVPG